MYGSGRVLRINQILVMTGVVVMMSVIMAEKWSVAAHGMTDQNAAVRLRDLAIRDGRKFIT